MSFQILLNLFLAFVWMFIKNSYTGNTFLIGYILGLLILFAFRHFFPGRFYIRRVYAACKLFLIFLKELLLANYQVVKIVLKPKLDMHPGIFRLETELTKDWEILLLSNLITLTPGTLVIEVSPDNKTLYIHAIDIQDMESSVAAIKNSFEKAIMEVSK